MQWYNIIVVILGAIGGAGGLVTLFTARAKRDEIDTNSFTKLFNKAQEERDNMDKRHKEYVADSERRMKNLEEKVEKLEKRDTIKLRAINSAYRCKLPDAINECPVLKTLDEECDKNEGVCKIK